MKNYYFIFCIALLASTSCGKKKQSLAIEEEKAEEISIMPKDSIQRSMIVYNAAEATPMAGESKPQTGKRVTNNTSPPIKLSVCKDGLESKKIDLANYYSKVSYIKIGHPLEVQGGTYLGDVNINEIFEKGRRGYSSGFSSDVVLTSSQIIAGDRYYGYHVYDLTGKFLYTLAVPDKFPRYAREQSSVFSDHNNLKGLITNISINDRYAIIGVKENSNYNIHTYDLVSRRGISAFTTDKPSYTAKIINDSEYLDYPHFLNYKERKKPIMECQEL